MINYLFPYKYKKVGYGLFLSGVFCYLMLFFFDYKYHINYFVVLSGLGTNVGSMFEWEKQDIFNEFTTILLLVGCILSLFSKEKIEDEFITKIRLESLVLGIYINIIIQIIITLLVFSLLYLISIMYTVFTYLIFSFIIFQYKLYQNKLEINNEK